MTGTNGTTLYAEDVTVGDEGPRVVEDITTEDIARYAGASGDFNPIHYDHRHAIDAGHPSVIAHGMLLCGFTARQVAEWFGHANVRRLRTRFAARVFPGDTVTVTGEIVDKYEDDGEVLVDAEIEATKDDGTVVLSGDATATLPSRSS